MWIILDPLIIDPLIIDPLILTLGMIHFGYRDYY